MLTLVFVFMLGMRHGLDADHLAAIDGFSRLRPSRWNGVLFGLGHGLVVTLLALIIERLGENFGLSWISPYLFLLVATLNLWRLLRPQRSQTHPLSSLMALGPLLMGFLLAVGMETSSQLSALALSAQVPPLLLGLTFTLGMVLTDGLDGLIATNLQRGQNADLRRSELASRIMGWMVVLLATSFAVSDFVGWGLTEYAEPLGVAVFVFLLGLRIWSRLGRGERVQKVEGTSGWKC